MTQVRHIISPNLLLLLCASFFISSHGLVPTYHVRRISISPLPSTLISNRPCIIHSPNDEVKTRLHARREAAAVMGTVTSGEMRKSGGIMSFLSKFIITPEKYTAMVSALKHSLEPVDLLVITILGYAPVPIANFFHNKLQKLASEDETVNGKKVKFFKKVDFDQTYLFQVADHVSQAAKIGGFVYAINCVTAVLASMGFEFARKFPIPKICGQILYTLWIALRFSVFKRYLISKAVRRPPDDLGDASIYNRFFDSVIYACSGLFILDIFSIQMGMALSSLFALGGAGTFVLGLASKDVATQLVNGFALSATDKFREGEEVALGDGTEGVVTDISWMDTKIRCGDELHVRIPNSQLYHQRIRNVSRVRKCQVKQTLRFNYKDAQLMPKVINDIKAEIKKSCPRLITDGSRPFRVHMRDFKDDHISVFLDLHFEIPPTGDVYWDNRQRVLDAILRAMKTNNVQFALPSYEWYQSGHTNKHPEYAGSFQ